MLSHSLHVWVLAVLLPLLSGSGCASSGAYRNGVYHAGGLAFSIGDPGPRWKRIEVDRARTLAFVAREGDAVLQASGSCDASLDAPLSALTGHLLVGFTERVIVLQQVRPLAGREALFTHARAKLDGVEREHAFVVVKRNGCVFDFALIASPGPAFEETTPTFERFVGGFAVRGERP